MKILSILVVVGFCSPLFAKEYPKDSIKKGLAIAIDLDKNENGFFDQKAKMKMILRDRRGKESLRDINVSTLEVEADGNKTLLHFNSPKTVKGTKFLTYSHKTGDDDQWLYLPKIKRVKRISSSNKSGSFMASEFAYEDISSEEVEKYTYKFLKEEKLEGLDCYVIERIPVNKTSGYSKQIVWIVKGEKELRPLQTKFYDKKNSHFKTLKFENYKKYLGKFWRAEKMLMKNLLNKKSTDLIWSNYKFKTGVNESSFTSSSLKR